MHIDIDFHWLPRDCDACLQHTATDDTCMQMASNARRANATSATQRMHSHNTTLKAELLHMPLLMHCCCSDERTVHDAHSAAGTGQGTGVAA